MESSPDQRPVREVVDEMFASLGLSEDARNTVVETILIRNGQYAGHCFRAGALRAVWFLDSDHVEVRNAHGQIVASGTTRRDGVRAA